VRIVDAGAALAGAPAVLLRRASVDSLFAIAAGEIPLPPGIAARLDARGAWTFWNVDPGAYVLAFGVPGQRLRGCREVGVRGGANDFFLDLSRTAVSGTIARDANQPAAAAQILVVEPSRAYEWRNAARRYGNSDANWADVLALGAEHRAGVADENGAYRLLGLPLAEPFGADPGAPVVDVAVQPAGALEVRAAPTQIALPCTLLAFPADRRSMPRIRRVFPGQSEFLGALEPGSWDLELAVDGARARDRRRVEVVAKEIRTVELSLP